jgi:hypothetical protein
VGRRLSAALLSEIEALDDPNQDNVSLCVIKVIGLEVSEPALRPDIGAVRGASEAAAPSSLTVVAGRDARNGNLYCIARKVRA